MSEKIEINTLITKHENKYKNCRFEMIDVEDPLWEYGYPLKRVLIDNQTGETYDEVGKLVGLLNKLDKENKQLKKSEKINMEYAEQIVKENQKLRIAKNDLRREKEQLQKENEQLKIANANWLDKSLQDKQIRYSNANHKELTTKYLQLKEENEQLRKQLDFYLLDEFEWKEKYGDCDE